MHFHTVEKAEVKAWLTLRDFSSDMLRTACSWFASAIRRSRNSHVL